MDLSKPSTSTGEFQPGSVANFYSPVNWYFLYGRCTLWLAVARASPSSAIMDLPELIQRTLPLNLSTQSSNDSDSEFPEGGSPFHIQHLRLLFLVSHFADLPLECECLHINNSNNVVL